MPETVIQICEERYVTSPPAEVNAGLSPRIRNLRRLALSFANELDPTERGSAVMDAYDESASEPVIIRRAKAVANVLNTQSLILDEGQLIVGRVQRLIPAHYGIHSGYEWKRAVGYPEGGGGRIPDNVANSLAAIKKLVFEEKAIPLIELRDALKDDFHGQESLRQMLLNRPPKYGNGDEYVDSIAAEEASFYCDEVARYSTPEGGRHHALIFGVSPGAVYGLANRLGASADGRRKGDPLAMSVCTTHGTERIGATATVKSAASLDYTKTPGGVSFILDLHPTAVAGDGGLDKLISLLRTFFDNGGMEIGLNIVSDEELRKAQKNPERYSHIMVRVFGFSTQFISLSRELQDYVIEKTKQLP